MNEKIRGLFPATNSYTYLNSAAVAPLPTTAVDAVISQLRDVSANGSETYLVSLSKEEFHVQHPVYAFDPMDDGLGKFFEELAALWRGWTGSKVWNSLEGEFTLKCNHDGLGHVTVDASLRDYGSWDASLKLNLLAPDFDEYASKIKLFFLPAK